MIEVVWRDEWKMRVWQGRVTFYDKWGNSSEMPIRAFLHFFHRFTMILAKCDTEDKEEDESG